MYAGVGGVLGMDCNNRDSMQDPPARSANEVTVARSKKLGEVVNGCHGGGTEVAKNADGKGTELKQMYLEALPCYVVH